MNAVYIGFILAATWYVVHCIHHTRKPMKTYYISFAAVIGGFQGSIITEAVNEEQAYRKVTASKINPGGEAAIIEIPPSQIPDRKYFDRLLSEQQIGEFWSDLEHSAPPEQAVIVCGECNDRHN